MVFRRVGVLSVLLCAVQVLVFAETLDKADVNPFDRAMMFPYSAGLDTASNVTMYASMALPLSFAAIAPSKDWTGLAVMYAGSTALTYGIRSGLKNTVYRDRPFMYYDGTRPPDAEPGDTHMSFPSGHTTFAFNAASFTATTFALYYPDSRWRTPVTAAAFTLAGATAALRVTSGNHFVTDTLAGALIGSFTGFIVPYAAHEFGFFKPTPKGTLTVTPYCVAYRLEL